MDSEGATGLLLGGVHCEPLVFGAQKSLVGIGLRTHSLLNQKLTKIHGQQCHDTQILALLHFLPGPPVVALSSPHVFVCE